MAEYYPLLAKAVAGRHNAPAEERLSIYDRARQALIGQLRSMNVPEDAINRESASLDEAIARVEAEVEASTKPPAVAPPPGVAAPAAPPVPSTAAPPPLPPLAAPPPLPPPAAPPPVSPSAAPPPVSPSAAPPPGPPVAAPAPVAPVAAPPRPIAIPPAPTPATAAPSAAAPPPVILPEPPQRGAGEAPPAPMIPGASPRAGARPAAEALSRIVAERGPAAPDLRAFRTDGDGSPSGEPAPRAAPPLPFAPKLQVPSFTDVLAATDAAAVAEREGAEPDEGAPARDEPMRPPAPRPAIQKGFNPRFLILALVGIAVVAGIAYTAWRLRDKPDALARSRAAMVAAEQAEPAQPAKVSARADAPAAAGKAKAVPDGTQAVPDGTPPDTARPAAETATPSSTPEIPPTTAAPSQPMSAASTDQPPAPAVAGPASQAGEASLPVSQRAALLVDAPDDPQKVKTYVGTVVWSIDTASPAQNQPIAQAVRAEVDVPEASLKMSMVFQKNFEAQFPASHTLEFRFTLAPGSSMSAIKQINAPLMRKDDSPLGDALLGLPVTITENYFLVGLSRGDAVNRNLDLIKSRNWFDVPILLASGRVAKITFEKGATGQKIIDSVLQSWQ